MAKHNFVLHIAFALLCVAPVACTSPGRVAPTATEAPAAPTIASTAAAPTAAPTATEAPTTAPPATEAPPVETATEPTTAPLSFTPATYADPTAGFALEYPAVWTVDPSSQIGVRGGQALLLSPGTTLEAVAEGGTRVSITTNVWDPKGDLDAYVNQRKTAWEASGFAITREEAWTLPDGRAARIFIVESPDVPVFYLLTTIGDDYLQIGGEGDLMLVEEMARTLHNLE